MRLLAACVIWILADACRIRSEGSRPGSTRKRVALELSYLLAYASSKYAEEHP